MSPVAFSINGFEIRWYGILIAIGLFLAMNVAIRNGEKLGVKQDDILDYVLIAAPISIICARAYYVIFNWQYYKGDFLKMINIRLGGLAIHGGLIGASIVMYFFCKYKNINFLNFLDIASSAVPLGQSIGRWGNYMNKEAYGTPTNLPWAITINGTKVHPTFLYESIWDFLLFLFLTHLIKTKKFNGQIVALYLIIYSVGRFFIEGLRTDSLMFLGMRVAQIISLILIMLGIALYYFAKYKLNK